MTAPTDNSSDSPYENFINRKECTSCSSEPCMCIVNNLEEPMNDNSSETEEMLTCPVCTTTCVKENGSAVGQRILKCLNTRCEHEWIDWQNPKPASGDDDLNAEELKLLEEVSDAYTVSKEPYPGKVESSDVGAEFDHGDILNLAEDFCARYPRETNVNVYRNGYYSGWNKHAEVEQEKQLPENYRKAYVNSEVLEGVVRLTQQAEKDRADLDFEKNMSASLSSSLKACESENTRLKKVEQLYDTLVIGHENLWIKLKRYEAALEKACKVAGLGLDEALNGSAK